MGPRPWFLSWLHSRQQHTSLWIPHGTASAPYMAHKDGQESIVQRGDVNNTGEEYPSLCSAFQVLRGVLCGILVSAPVSASLKVDGTAVVEGQAQVLLGGPGTKAF